jgi:hypothetical protein
MNKPKDSKERHIPCGISLPGELIEEIDRYNLACGTGESRSEFICNLAKSVIDEWKKDQQTKESIEPANKKTYRSPLGTAMSMMSLSVQVAADVSKDDINSNISDKKLKLKPESPKAVKKKQALVEAIAKDRERHPETERNNQNYE